jgi:hypothetical protein
MCSLRTVTDDGTPPLSAFEYITITVGNVNRRPILNPIGNKNINEGELLSFIVTATDPDRDTLIYSASNLPPGANFDNPTQTFTWRANYDQAGSYKNVRFTVTDSGGLPATEAITITVANVNRPPVLDPIGAKTVLEGQTLQFTITGSDPDGDALTFGADMLPPGAVFSGQIFTWTPSYAQAENYQVAFWVQDNGSPMGVDTELVPITVGNVDRPPAFDPVGPQQGMEGQLLQFYVHATDPDGDVITYSASNLPPGAAFNPVTRLFTWTPGYGLAATYTAAFTASDGTLSGETFVVITVNRPTPSQLCTAIVNQILDLKLDNSVQNSYMANIKKVDDFIAKGQKTPAINQIDAFTSKVTEDIRKGKISATNGNTLIQMATELRAILNV